jgi:hypothetical protein
MLDLTPFAPLTEEDLLARLAWLRDAVAPRLKRYLGYYRNPTTDLASVLPCSPAASFPVRPFRQYQELGLPARITGFRCAADGTAVATGTMDVQRKEVVIENDIAWRINTLVDFAAGRPPAVTSTAKDPAMQSRLTAVIQGLLGLDGTQAGGVALLQALVLQGAIAGSAWVQLRPSPELLSRLSAQLHHRANAGSDTGGDPPATDNASPASRDFPADAGRWLALEVVEAARLCPLPQGGDAHTSALTPPTAALLTAAPASPGAPMTRRAGLLERVRTWLHKPLTALDPEEFSFDLFNDARWQCYVRGELIHEGENLLGVVPFVRYENAPDPAAGTRVGSAGSALVDAGLGDVEPLVGLQDELNTRLSDRAFRVTISCFRMYLGRGIEDFMSRPVGPGQMWATDNPDASIEAFGGDATMPSEDAHINEIREALDKISGVSPVAAGLIRGKLGNLTSAVALRLTLIALLARTERKRAALTRTLAEVVRLALAVLDRAGIISSAPEDRGIDVNWPTPLPESDMDRLAEAQAKLALGIPRSVVLTELGYGELSPEAVRPAEPARSITAPPAELVETT